MHAVFVFELRCLAQLMYVVSIPYRAILLRSGDILDQLWSFLMKFCITFPETSANLIRTIHSRPQSPLAL